MSHKNQLNLAVKTLINLPVLSLIYACYYWVRFHRYPTAHEWEIALVVWSVFYSVQGAYRRILGELERHNALLIQVLTRLEELGRRERAA